MTDLNEIHAQRIRELPFWRVSITLERLYGGITNRNFLVKHGAEQFFARIGEELHILGVDRRNEALCHRAAEALGIAPPIALAERGVLVSQYVIGRTLDPESSREPGLATRVAHLLRRLHDGWDRVVGDLLFFSPFQVNRTYVSTSRRLGGQLPDDIDDMIESTRQLSRELAPYVPCLCHNDMLPANVLDDGTRVWIVDWEYAGMGHPLFDLAGFSVNCGFSEEMDIQFLTDYRGEFRPVDLRELRVLKVASLLREALWSVVQSVASDLDFDFHEYAQRHFKKFRSELRSLAG